MACYYANTDTSNTAIAELNWDSTAWAAAEPIVLEDVPAKEEVPEPPPPQFVRERVDEHEPRKPVPVARNMERQRSPPREARMRYIVMTIAIAAFILLAAVEHGWTIMDAVFNRRR